MEHQLDATITVLLISTIHIVQNSNAQKPCLPHQQDIIPYVVKSQSCAPEDGQMFARNMLC
jgi:hypothetical protein